MELAAGKSLQSIGLVIRLGREFSSQNGVCFCGGRCAQRLINYGRRPPSAPQVGVVSGRRLAVAGCLGTSELFVCDLDSVGRAGARGLPAPFPFLPPPSPHHAACPLPTARRLARAGVSKGVDPARADSRRVFSFGRAASLEWQYGARKRRPGVVRSCCILVATCRCWSGDA